MALKDSKNIFIAFCVSSEESVGRLWTLGSSEENDRSGSCHCEQNYVTEKVVFFRLEDYYFFFI